MMALWLRWKWYAIGGGFLLACLFGYIAHRESTAVWRALAHVRDSTAKVEQRNRARVERLALDAIIRNDSLERSIGALQETADAARDRASVARNEAATAKGQRAAAIASLTRSQTVADSVRALVAKSHADDSLIASHERTIAAQGQESAALRQVIDSTRVIHGVLIAALDSASLQLRRDGQVIEQLQGLVRSARPTSGVARRWGERLLWAGAGYAVGSLTTR